MYEYKDYFESYGRIMQFNKNKSEPFHRWYPFVEGYSKEFIRSIILELDTRPEVCLEPFSGSGTTALELQNMGIKCISFEVNPLMYLIARVKLENEYDINVVRQYFDYIVQERMQVDVSDVTSDFKTLIEKENIKKWNYDQVVAVAIKKLQVVIEQIDDIKYRELFQVALAAILLDVSNLYRNGKCLSYKKGWENKKFSEKQVFQKFDDKVKNQLMVDIINSSRSFAVKNKNYLYNEDSRVGIMNLVQDDTVDLVITSPPYLNSRDYTDTYMLELKTLGFTKSNDEIRKLRERTLRSHVQIKWNDATRIKNKLLDDALEKLQEKTKDETLWNTSLIDMVRLYFVDMQAIFESLHLKMKHGGKVYFNVSNSAYYGVLINTLEICASIAENVGFRVIEIRKARLLKTSPQQKEDVDKLLEGVIVLQK